MIKVLSCIYGLKMGGAESLLKDYMINMDDKKFKKIVVCLSRSNNNEYEKILLKHNVKVIYIDDFLPFKGSTNIIHKIIRKPLRYIYFKKIIISEKPDIIHGHLLINSYILFARTKKKTKLFYTIHSEPSKLWKNNKLDYFATKYLVKHKGMRIIALHDRMKEEIDNQFGINNSLIINNGIDIRRYTIIKDETIRKKLRIPNSAFIVGHIGRFSEAKNHEFLIQVFAEIKKRNKNSYLLMIGDGDKKQEIKKSLHDHRLERSYKILSNRTDIPELLSIMDAFVFPSLYEGLPVSLIEAQVANIPCYISDTITEYAIISNLVTRISLNDGPQKWAQKIISYKRPQKVYVNHKDWDIKLITKELEQLYEKEIFGTNK